VILVAPTTSPERLPKLAAAADGYIYCLTRTGVTGSGGAFAANLAAQVEGVRACTSLPVVAGFGIRAPEDAQALAGVVDGVVVGARLIEILDDPKEPDPLAALSTFVRGLRAALGGAGT
jgi:tryptophan synthase alpha chain